MRRKEGWTWVLRYRINGKEQTPLIVGLVSDFATEDEANVEVDRLGLRTQINVRGRISQGRMNFAELAEFYLMVVTDPTITASPMDENTMPILKHNVRDYLIAKWGSNIAEEIEPLEIQKWLVSLRTTPIKDATGRVLKGGLAWPTISKLRGTMSEIYKAGSLHKRVTINPVEGVRTSSKSKYKAIKLTPAQTLSVLKQLMENPLHFILVFTVATTAVRSSEVVSLRWLDIDWDGRFIRVEKARKKSGVDGDTKTESSKRDAGMGKVLTHYLMEWRKQTPYGKEEDFVFPSLKMRGKVPISSPAFVKDHLRPAALKAGVKIPAGYRFGLHNLRHSLSNWLVNKAKENPKTVQGILGHSRIQTTLDLYSDSDLDSMIEAQDRYVDAVGV
ncbi:MAG TPA: site-specific integrase [Terriglobales bacterium]|nr:site-specific integrase [Terriglobales bacterium]